MTRKNVYSHNNNNNNNNNNDNNVSCFFMRVISMKRVHENIFRFPSILF